MKDPTHAEKVQALLAKLDDEEAIALTVYQVMNSARDHGYTANAAATAVAHLLIKAGFHR